MEPMIRFNPLTQLYESVPVPDETSKEEVTPAPEEIVETKKPPGKRGRRGNK